MSSEMFHTIEAIGREKGIETGVIIEALEEAYAAATRKYYRSKQDFGARFDPESGAFAVFAKHTGSRIRRRRSATCSRPRSRRSPHR